MQTGRLTPAEDDRDGRRRQIAWAVPRVLLGAGLIAVALAAAWSARQHHWLALAAALGLCTGVLICYCWQWYVVGRRLRNPEDSDRDRERIFTSAVLDSVPGIPYMFDAEGRLVRWNKKQVEMTGYSADGIGADALTDWFRGEDVAYVAARMEKVLADGYADAEADLITKDGTQCRSISPPSGSLSTARTTSRAWESTSAERKAAEEAIPKERDALPDAFPERQRCHLHDEARRVQRLQPHGNARVRLLARGVDRAFSRRVQPRTASRRPRFQGTGGGEDSGGTGGKAAMLRLDASTRGRLAR